jgi:hypothetical protein
VLLSTAQARDVAYRDVNGLFMVGREGMMSTQMVYTSIGVWLAIVAAVVGFGLFSGVPMTMGMGSVAMVVGFMLPAILLMLRWGAGPQTVAQPLKGRR